MTSQSNDGPGNMKDLGREGRLSFRKCAKEEGVMVVFRCREFQKAVHECMAVYNSPERFEIYKKEHEEDLENKVIRSRP
eukprot:scaffold24613_cov176-Cylindrotheca_fusiformis.AAC.2